MQIPLTRTDTAVPTADPKKKGAVLLADPDDTTYIRWNVTAGDTGGVLHFRCEWESISDDGFLENA